MSDEPLTPKQILNLKEEPVTLVPAEVEKQRDHETLESTLPDGILEPRPGVAVAAEREAPIQLAIEVFDEIAERLSATADPIDRIDLMRLGAQASIMAAKLRERKPAAEPEQIRIVFDGPPSHESGRFVEVEDANGRSVSVGEWHDRGDGTWELRLMHHAQPGLPVPQPKRVDLTDGIVHAARVSASVRALVEVELEARDALSKHREFSGPHEGWAVIFEELDELWEEVKNHRTFRSTAKMRNEAKQVAAMAIRFMVECCGG